MFNLESVLRKEYGDKVSISMIRPLHDEDFDACYMVCYDNVMIIRADSHLKEICEAIENYMRK